MDSLRIVPLGGLGEFGSNMMVLEYRDSVIGIDCGVMFPSAELQILPYNRVVKDLGGRSGAQLLDELATRLANRIAAYGYDAKVQANKGDIPLPAYGQLAGLGELGKHGSLISPELGSAFRISAVSTDMPLVADGPKDFGIDEICTNCDICTRFCPGEAIRPQKVDVDGMIRWQVDTPACHPHFLRLYTAIHDFLDTLGEVGVNALVAFKIAIEIEDD